MVTIINDGPMTPIEFRTVDNRLYATIAFNEELKCYQDTWFGSFGSQENFQNVLLTLIELFEKHKASKILTDLSQMVGSFDSSKEWILKEIFPRLIQLGLQYQAVVVPKNIFAALAAPKKGMFEKRQFEDVEEARKWLMSIKSITPHTPLEIQLQEQFLKGVQKFDNNPLHQKLRDNARLPDKFNFVHRMLFFVMGFRDMMKIVRYEPPQNELEVSVNKHSDEDGFHWIWYLKDLQTVDLRFKDQDPVDLVTEVWGDDTFDVRTTVYSFMRHLLDMKDPAARMLIIEVLELTFDKFKEAIHPVLKDSSLYDRLDYFGKKHQETEENHSTGISDDEIMNLIKKLPENLKEELIHVIEHLFDCMYTMAGNWAK